MAHLSPRPYTYVSPTGKPSVGPLVPIFRIDSGFFVQRTDEEGRFLEMCGASEFADEELAQSVSGSMPRAGIAWLSGDEPLSVGEPAVTAFFDGNQIVAGAQSDVRAHLRTSAGPVLLRLRRRPYATAHFLEFLGERDLADVVRQHRKKHIAALSAELKGKRHKQPASLLTRTPVRTAPKAQFESSFGSWVRRWVSRLFGGWHENTGASHGTGSSVSFRPPTLAWSTSFDDARRMQSAFGAVGALTLVLCVVFGSYSPALTDRSRPAGLSPVMAKLLLDKAPTPPGPPVNPRRVEPFPQRTAIAAVRPEAPRPRSSPTRIKPTQEDEALALAKTPDGSTEGARRRAAGVGLLAAQEELAPLRGKTAAVQLNPDIKQGPGVGTGVDKGVGAGNEDGVPTRALITSNANSGSGGINSSAFSRNTGGSGLGGRSTTLVAGGSPNGSDGGTQSATSGSGGGRAGAGGRGGEGNVTGTGTGKGGTLNKGGGKASRSIEEIKLVFERNKGAIYAIYNRALREDPSLQGKVVLELTIAPSGELTNCGIISSELHAPELESKLLARIRQFDFGAKDVDQMVVTWPVDFLPS